MGRTIRIFDTTLRDGEQSPGCSMNLNEKIEVAKQLEMLKVDIGSGSDKYISTSISFNLFDFSVDFSTAEGALESLESIDEMLSSVSDQLLNIGNTINRMESVSEAQSIKLNNLISFRSTMRDADIAEESSNYIRYQILQQASATLLASSRNLKAQNVMGLLSSVNH